MRSMLKKMRHCNEQTKNYQLLVKDEGPGFSEESTQKIFRRFYSNRPTKFGNH